MAVFLPLYQITDLHARHKRTLFCRELPLVSLSCPHRGRFLFKDHEKISIQVNLNKFSLTSLNRVLFASFLTDIGLWSLVSF